MPWKRRYWSEEEVSSSASDSDSQHDDGDSKGHGTGGKNMCFRCQRVGHWASECYARTDVHGKTLGGSKQSAGVVQAPKDSAGVYAIEYPDGSRYVGKSTDVSRRVEEHKMNSVSGVPRRVSLLTTGDRNDLEGWERSETLAQMRKHGVDNVRGWKYTSTDLSKKQRVDAEEQIRERFDLCRNCGKAGHFASACLFKKFRS